MIHQVFILYASRVFDYEVVGSWILYFRAQKATTIARTFLKAELILLKDSENREHFGLWGTIALDNHSCRLQYHNHLFGGQGNFVR